MNDSTLSHDLYHFSNHLSDLLQGTFEQADEITPPPSRTSLAHRFEGECSSNGSHNDIQRRTDVYRHWGAGVRVPVSTPQLAF
jgi:hypothetical protein